MFARLFRKKTRPRKQVTYEEAKKLARDSDEEIRVGLAGRADVEPEILYFLAEDPSPRVRQAIASNDAAPSHADLLLARDADDEVRETLAEKIARLAPGMSEDEQDRARKMAFDALELLARDQAVRVRQILSETLKELADTPPEVIRRLARDVEAVVSTPVLMFSPVLNDDDLLEIIGNPPTDEARSAISRRDGVSERISDAIVETDDVAAIGYLLGNDSAQIREETLDHVIDRAVDIDGWHAPLAMRSNLSRGAAVKIARFVAEDILNRMAEREDMPAETVEAVRDIVHKRLGGRTSIVPEGGLASVEGVKVDDGHAFDQASRLWAEGRLDRDAVVEAIEQGDRPLAQAMIAVLGDLPLRVVSRTCENESAKGCVALAWKAGLGGDVAELIQLRLGGISPRDLLRARGTGYPLSEDDLVWQLDFIRGL